MSPLKVLRLFESEIRMPLKSCSLKNPGAAARNRERAESLEIARSVEKINTALMFIYYLYLRSPNLCTNCAITKASQSRQDEPNVPSLNESANRT